MVFALFAALGTAAQASSPVLGLAWSELFALLLPAAVVAAGSNLEPRRALLLERRPTTAVLGLAVLVGVTGFFAAGALMALTSIALPQRWLEIFDVAKLFDRPPLERVALGVAAATLAPFCEEVAFRGWLLTALRTRHRSGVAIGTSALLFATMHLDPVRFSALLALGSLYGWLAWRAGSVWPAVVAHATNNALGVALAATGNAETSLQPGRAPPLQIALASLLTLSVASVALRLAAAGYRRATPAPPPAQGDLVRRDPAVTSTAFDFGRVPPRLLALIVFAAGSLVALVLSGRRWSR